MWVLPQYTSKNLAFKNLSQSPFKKTISRKVTRVLVFWIVVKISYKSSFKNLVVENIVKNIATDSKLGLKMGFKMESRIKCLFNSFISLSTKKKILEVAFDEAKRARKAQSLQR